MIDVASMQGLTILLSHFVGDFILQNDWMANNKKKSSWACGLHVATYMIPFLWCGFAWWQLALIGAQHFLQDRTGFVVWFLENTGKKQFAEPPLAPWSTIVVDNTFHLLWILLVALLPYT